MNFDSVIAALLQETEPPFGGAGPHDYDHDVLGGHLHTPGSAWSLGDVLRWDDYDTAGQHITRRLLPQAQQARPPRLDMMAAQHDVVVALQAHPWGRWWWEHHINGVAVRTLARKYGMDSPFLDKQLRDVTAAIKRALPPEVVCSIEQALSTPERENGRTLDRR